MILTEKQLYNIIEEETKKYINEILILEQTRWKIPDDNTYEYSLTPDGKGYIAYKDGKVKGTLNDAAGLKKVKDAAPSRFGDLKRAASDAVDRSKDCPSIPKSWRDVYPNLVKVGRINNGDKVIIVDGRSQTLKVVRGQNIVSYPCSTGRKGFSNTSFERTATGLAQVHAKIGSGQPYGRIFVGKKATKYVLKDNQGKHAWVCTRALVLAGQQSENENLYSRNIYIHGTNRLSNLGKMASGGCIRVSNNTILKLFDEIANGTLVYILGNPTSTNPEFPCGGRGITSSARDWGGRLGSAATGFIRRRSAPRAQVSGEPVYEAGEPEAGENIIGEPPFAPDLTA